MIVIGIDSALNKTGVAIYSSNYKAIVWTKQICPSLKFTFGKKLVYIKQEFEKIFKICKSVKFVKTYSSEAVAVVFEDQYFRLNNKVLKRLSMVRGVVQCMAMELWGTDCIFVYAATSWRSILGIKSNREIKVKKKRVQDLKNQAVKIAKKNSSVLIPTEDEAEASCIALAHFIKSKGE